MLPAVPDRPQHRALHRRPSHPVLKGRIPRRMKCQSRPTIGWRFDAVPQRTVQPQKLKNGTWAPGGGTEAATTKSHPVFGFSKIK
jgi:hypothetical protein